jgi:AraC-like DNA-binding protein
MLYRVAALVRTESEAQHLRSALRSAATVECCADRRALLGRLRTSTVDCVLLDCDDRAHCTAALISELREGFPGVPLVGWLTLVEDNAQRLVELIRAGLTEVDFKGPSSRLACGRILRTALTSSALLECKMSIRRCYVGEPARIICGVFDLVAYTPGARVADVARMFGIPRRTLDARLARLGLPSSGALLNRCRVLYAAALLRDPGRSVNRVSALMGFSSGPGLRNLIRRHIGVRPCDLRDASLAGRLLPELFTPAARAHQHT